MGQAVHIMKTLNAIGEIVAVTIIALAGIAMVAAAAAASLLVQSASATTDLMTTTTSVGGGEEEGVSTTTTNNTSNATLGSLFLTEEAEFTSFNPINETYIEISFVGNATIMPPNATNTINATETGNITLNIQPNGVNFVQGQAFLDNMLAIYQHEMYPGVDTIREWEWKGGTLHWRLIVPLLLGTRLPSPVR